MMSYSASAGPLTDGALSSLLGKADRSQDRAVSFKKKCLSESLFLRNSSMTFLMNALEGLLLCGQI